MIYIASDHRGFEFKKEIEQMLDDLGHAYEDMGPSEYVKTDDYPDYAFKVAEKVTGTEDLGILTCDTGTGMDIASNKVKGIRAALVTNELQARRSREHDNANILVLQEEGSDRSEIKKLIKIWLESKFSGDERHIRRMNKISDYEK